MRKQKIIVIGDIHGEQVWKEVIKKHPESKYIFLGDYCDPYHIIPKDDVIINLQDIINFKKQASTDVVLLLGNHDIQYIYKEAEYCTRRMEKEEFEIRRLFENNLELFDWAYKLENFLFTHAGISQGWFRFSFPNKDNSNILEIITAEEYRDLAFACGYARGGNVPYGGFFWAGKNEMADPLNGYIQIVGHNRVPEITVKRSGENGIVIFCDSLWNGRCLVIEEAQDNIAFFEVNMVENTLNKILSVVKDIAKL